MIDIQQLRHYVKAMRRIRKYLALSPLLAALLVLAFFSTGAGAGTLPTPTPTTPARPWTSSPWSSKAKPP